VSVDIATPQPSAPAPPALTARYSPTGTHDHPEQPRRHGQQEAAAVAEVAEVDLASCLQADHQEEERHQAAVDPRPQIAGDAVVAEAEAERRRPQPLVAVTEVGPHQPGDDGGHEDAGAAGLGLQERPDRRRELAPPRGAQPTALDRPVRRHRHAPRQG
jgi:hypothetical protein